MDTSFDFGGSTRILVTLNGNRLTGSVSPHVMAHASPIWNKFLFPPFKKLESSINIESNGSQSAGDREISRDSHLNVEPSEELDFSEDPAEALRLLLSIVHFKFNNIPVQLNLAHLWQVAMLCDQYDCVHLVKPWLSNWLATEDSAWQGAKAVQRENWLFVAWVFGRQKVFGELAQLLVLETSVNSSGKCSAQYSGAGYGPMPPDIIEGILRIRKKAIAGLLEITRKCCQEYITVLKPPPPSYMYSYQQQDRKKALCKHGHQGCDAISYGSLMGGLEAIGVKTSTTADLIEINVKQLAEKINGLTIHVYPPTNDGYKRVTHEACFTTNIKDEVAKVLSTVENPVLESHLRHLSTQATKLSHVS